MVEKSFIKAITHEDRLYLMRGKKLKKSDLSDSKLVGILAENSRDSRELEICAKHPNAQVRLEAAQNVLRSDRMVEMLKKDPDDSVRRSAEMPISALVMLKFNEITAILDAENSGYTGRSSSTLGNGTYQLNRQLRHQRRTSGISN